MRTTFVRRTFFAPLMSLLLLVPAAVAAAPKHAHAQTVAAAGPIVMKNFNFMPMMVTVHVGDTVTWKNLDEEPHTVTSLDGLFRSGALDTGETFKFKFTKAGTFKYTCSIHPKMQAMVVVK